MDDLTLQNKIQDEATKVFKKMTAFTVRTLADTPTDDLAVVNRKYVTMNGTTGNRPKSSVIGQQYFDTSLGNGKPVYWNGTGFVDATGTYV
jgi:hypothetical protein